MKACSWVFSRARPPCHLLCIIDTRSYAPIPAQGAKVSHPRSSGNRDRSPRGMVVIILIVERQLANLQLSEGEIRRRQFHNNFRWRLKESRHAITTTPFAR
jgi:hypothetical protein